MKKSVKPLLILLILIITPFFIASARAEDHGINYHAVFKFTAGIASAYMIHEAGHFIVAEATGTDLDWEIGSYNQPIGYTESDTSDSAGVAVNSAGLISQGITSEVILQVDAIDKNGGYVRGIMAWNILNPIMYSLDYWFFRRTNRTVTNRYRGDIEGVEYYSNRRTANVFAFSLAAITAFQGYRFLKTQTWAPDWAKGETHTVNLAPISSGGYAMLYQYRF
jgi:hypothetical protein